MIIDVGANFGSFSLDLAKSNPTEFVLAIEPVKELCLKIKTASQKEGLKNVTVLDCAIDETERLDHINVAEHHDWGVSSLLSFDNAKIQSDEYWSNRADLYFDRTQSVEVKRLDSILSNYLLEEDEINFIKIDAQGLDFNVLKSLGVYLNKLQAGMIEVSVDIVHGLYQSENYDLRTILNWLDLNGFKPYLLTPNDPASKEFNLYFCRKELEGRDIENRFSLRDADLYSGKFFWHLPSKKLENFEEKFHLLETQLNELNHELFIANETVDLLRNSMCFRIKRKIKKMLGEHNG